MKKLILLSFLFLIYGCASPPSVYPTAFKNISSNELLSRYEKKELGKVEVFASENLNGRLLIQINGTELNLNVGNIGANEGFVMYLPESAYMFWLKFDSNKIIQEHFSVKGGETIVFRLNKTGEKPTKVSSMPKKVNIISNGSLVTSSQIERNLMRINRERQPKFQFQFDEPINDYVNLNINILGKQDIEKLFINGVERVSFVLNSNGVINLSEKVNIGKNNFEIKIVNKQGYETVRLFNLEVLTDDEKKEIAEKKRQEQLMIERAALAKKIEEERVAKEGDGSPEDLLCKKYGLKPQTTGYAECRMRIDFAKAESKRQQEQYEREQAAYQSQLAAIEKERDRRRGAAMLELGARMMGGQTPLNALGSIGTGSPIMPTRPSTINQTITLPNGRMINCSTIGTMTNCF